MKWLYRFFVILGVIFFLLLLGVAYFMIADPYNLRPLIMSMYQQDSAGLPASNTGNETSRTTSVERVAETQASITPSVVNENQTKALESVGIDPASVPSQFTPEQTSCFVSILGQVRVDAIVAGDTPTPAEFFKAKDCL